MPDPRSTAPVAMIQQGFAEAVRTSGASKEDALFALLTMCCAMITSSAPGRPLAAWYTGVDAFAGDMKELLKKRAEARDKAN